MVHSKCRKLQGEHGTAAYDSVRGAENSFHLLTNLFMQVANIYKITRSWPLQQLKFK